METKEYYTPKISDLFVGYECEILKTKCKTTYNTVKEALDKNESIYKCTNYWESTTLSCIQSVGILATNIENIRAHYLCKQDIIDLGWEHKQYVKDSQLVFNYKKGEWYLDFWVGKIPYVEIGREGYDTGYAGNCKSKNELLKLMKDYLNIPI